MERTKRDVLKTQGEKYIFVYEWIVSNTYIDSFSNKTVLFDI